MSFCSPCAVALAASLMWSALSSSTLAGPPAPPSTQPLLPPEFALFQSRSAFALGGHTAAPAAAPAPESVPESSFVLRGIAQIDDHYIALFEDATGKNALQLNIGDPLASGRVKSIDLDQVEFECAGDCRGILVGQNLKGETVAPPPTSQPAAPAGPGDDSAGAAPPGGGPGQPPSPHGKHRMPQGQPNQ